MEAPIKSTDNKEMVRGAWGNKFEFFLTLIGSAVGLGNVWRFPYLLFKNGGGAFLIPFILMLLLVGIPLFYFEVNIGQFSSLGPLSMWKYSPLFKGLGYSMVFTALIISLYYNVIISWCLYFLFASFTNIVPWQDCENPWNTVNCTTHEEFRNITLNNWTYVIKDDLIINKSDLKTPSEEYYYRKVLQMSNGMEHMGGVIWQLACCLLLSWLIIYLVLIKGINSLGKVVYFTSIFPYILLTIILVRGVTLPGALQGIEFYIVPDFSKLMDLKVWSDAAIQVFFALCCCTGQLITIASYNPFNNNTLRDSILLPLINMLTSIYAGFVIFSVLGYMADMKGTSVAEVAADGPGLVFVVYPEGLSTMPAAPVWSVLFFFMMLVLGLSSMFGLAEAFFVSFIDEFPHYLRTSFVRGAIFRGVCILVFFIISLPMLTNGGFYLFSILDSYTSGFPLLIIGLIWLTSTMYLYGYKKLSEDIELMLGKKPHPFIMITLGLLTPAVVLFIIVVTSMSYKSPTLFNETYPFPAIGEEIGWLVVTFCLMFIPIYLIYALCKQGLLKFIYEASQPLEDWGPAKDENRLGRYSNQEKFGDYERNNVEAGCCDLKFAGKQTEIINGYCNSIKLNGLILPGDESKKSESESIAEPVLSGTKDEPIFYSLNVSKQVEKLNNEKQNTPFVKQVRISYDSGETISKEILEKEPRTRKISVVEMNDTKPNVIYKL